MKQCPYCSEDIQDSAKKCRYCGEWINSANGHPHRELTESEVLSDVMKTVPTEVKGWNWGAFAFGWIWCIWNYKIRAALLSFILMFIPIVNVVQMIIFGLKGSEAAWQNRKSDDLKQFLENQKKWNRAAIIFIFIICALLAIKIILTNQTP